MYARASSRSGSVVVDASAAIAAARAHFDSVSVSTGGFVGPGARYEPALWGQARLLATVLVVGDDGTVHVRIRGRAADNADLRGAGATLLDEEDEDVVALVL